MALISHKLAKQDMSASIEEIERRIISSQNNDVSIERKFQILEELLSFELGRFLILNKGLDGFWTHYILNYTPEHYRNSNSLMPYAVDLSETEKFILEKAPGVLASREKFHKILNYISNFAKEGFSIASIPSGVAADLLLPIYDNINNIKLLAIDLDKRSLGMAKKLAVDLDIGNSISFIQEDAWNLNIVNELDIVTSSALTIYESCDDKVGNLYKIFYESLKKGGVLITNFLTYPPIFKDQSEWNMKKINLYDAFMQKIIFSDIIGMNWECFRTSDKTIYLLQEAGFENIKIDYDERKIFPTVVARKI